MKDKEKQIDEMGKVMPEKIKDPLDNSRYIIFGKSLRREIARIYYNADYRKLPEDSVVLSREEYERLRKCREADYKTMTALRQANTELNECMDEMQDRIAELEKENAKLKGNIVYHEKCKEELVNACDGCNSKIEKFAERLKEKLEEYRLENEYFIKDEPNGNLWQLNSSVFYLEVTQDGGLVDETLKEFIND